MVWGVNLCREARPPNFANAKVRKKSETTKFATLRIVKASDISVLATPFLLYGAGKRHECPGFNETLMAISFHQTLTPYWKNRSMLLHHLSWTKCRKSIKSRILLILIIRLLRLTIVIFASKKTEHAVTLPSKQPNNAAWIGVCCYTFRKRV